MTKVIVNLLVAALIVPLCFTILPLEAATKSKAKVVKKQDAPPVAYKKPTRKKVVKF